MLFFHRNKFSSFNTGTNQIVTTGFDFSPDGKKIAVTAYTKTSTGAITKQAIIVLTLNKGVRLVCRNFNEGGFVRRNDNDNYEPSCIATIIVPCVALLYSIFSWQQAEAFADTALRAGSWKFFIFGDSSRL